MSYTIASSIWLTSPFIIFPFKFPSKTLWEFFCLLCMCIKSSTHKGRRRRKRKRNNDKRWFMNVLRKLFYLQVMQALLVPLWLYKKKYVLRNTLHITLTNFFTPYVTYCFFLLIYSVVFQCSIWRNFENKNFGERVHFRVPDCWFFFISFPVHYDKILNFCG